MEMIADHWYFDIGAGWNQKAVNDSRNTTPLVDKLGGGHSHIGCMILKDGYWPKQYLGKLFPLKQHGKRINVETLERSGSGYVGKHEPDIFFASDPFFVGLELSQGPDGSIYILDWNDTGECHEQSGVVRSTGRIYRIDYDYHRPAPKLDPKDAERMDMVAALRHGSRSNGWYSQQAQRELLNHAATGEIIE